MDGVFTNKLNEVVGTQKDPNPTGSEIKMTAKIICASHA
jgi:hypothetical protein